MEAEHTCACACVWDRSTERELSEPTWNKKEDRREEHHWTKTWGSFWWIHTQKKRQQVLFNSLRCVTASWLFLLIDGLEIFRECGLDTEMEKPKKKKKKKWRQGQVRYKQIETWREHQFCPFNRHKGEAACFPLSITDSRTISLIIWRNWDWRDSVCERETESERFRHSVLVLEWTWTERWWGLIRCPFFFFFFYTFKWTQIQFISQVGTQTRSTQDKLLDLQN